MTNDTERFKNRTVGRVYSPDGICPTLNTCTGGGKQPHIMVREESIKGKVKIVCEQRSDEGLRTFADGVIGTIRTIEAGGGQKSDRK